MTRSITVLNPGALSLVQDAGRTGYQGYGVSVSGAMDPEALFIGNHLIGNDSGAAVIEVTFGGAEFRFETELVAAITGGDLQPSLDGTPLDTWETFVAPSGSVLRFGVPVEGLRAYLCVEGGIDVPPVLGSRSTHVSSRIGGLAGAPLSAGDSLPVGGRGTGANPGNALPAELRNSTPGEITIRVVRGPQYSSFTDGGVGTFLSSAYTVSDKSDRQGLRLDGPIIETIGGKYDIVSDAVVFGSVQVPGDGRPIVLMADRQTTGGYAKIATVVSVDLSLLAQAPPGAVMRFEEISMQQAQSLLRQSRSTLLDTDFRSGLRSTSESINLGGAAWQMDLKFRPFKISSPNGGMVAVSTPDGNLTVRVAEVPGSTVQ